MIFEVSIMDTDASEISKIYKSIGIKRSILKKKRAIRRKVCIASMAMILGGIVFLAIGNCSSFDSAVVNFDFSTFGSILTAMGISCYVWSVVENPVFEISICEEYDLEKFQFLGLLNKEIRQLREHLSDLDEKTGSDLSKQDLLQRFQETKDSLFFEVMKEKVYPLSDDFDHIMKKLCLLDEDIGYKGSLEIENKKKNEISMIFDELVKTSFAETEKCSEIQ